MGVTWVCKKRLKTWQWFCLSQSYRNLTYLCLSSVRASKRSLYIFRAFSPSTSHIFNQDLTLKKHQCQHCQHWIFPAAILFETHPLLKENTCRRKKKNQTRSLSSGFPAHLYHYPGNLKFKWQTWRVLIVWLFQAASTLIFTFNIFIVSIYFWARVSTNKGCCCCCCCCRHTLTSERTGY